MDLKKLYIEYALYPAMSLLQHNRVTAYTRELMASESMAPDQRAALLRQRLSELLALCRSHGVPLIINDDAELAKKVGADGVHVGQSDLATQEARRILGPQAIIGVTARTVEQARAAQAAGADYLGSGAVFGTSSKSDARPLSREELRAICAAVTIPVVAIGGIHAGNVLALCGCGQAGVAVIGGIFGQPDIRQAARELLALSEQVSQNKI